MKILAVGKLKRKDFRNADFPKIEFVSSFKDPRLETFYNRAPDMISSFELARDDLYDLD